MPSIKQTFPLASQWPTLDPFLFCAYHKDDFPEGNGAFGPATSLSGRQIGQDFASIDGWNMYHGDRIPGFPVHPHRGFETVTVVNKGLVDHADSLGAAGRYGGGDAQWMTAGKGVQHSEMFPLLNEGEKNPLMLFQIWLNLPAKNKMVEPHFAMLWREQIPIVEVKDDNGLTTHVQVVAGELNGQRPPAPPPESWAAEKTNQVAIWNIRIPANGHFEIPAHSAQLNRVLYFYTGGSATIETQTVNEMTGLVLDAAASVQLQAHHQPCEFLLLQGKPIAEPVAQYGPFVMNTEQEIQQAFADYRRDQFGGWPWADADQIHREANTRFAKHADGQVEEKDLI